MESPLCPTSGLNVTLFNVSCVVGILGDIPHSDGPLVVGHVRTKCPELSCRPLSPIRIPRLLVLHELIGYKLRTRDPSELTLLRVRPTSIRSLVTCVVRPVSRLCPRLSSDGTVLLTAGRISAVATAAPSYLFALGRF